MANSKLIISLIILFTFQSTFARDLSNPAETPYRSDDANDYRIGDWLFVDGEIHKAQPEALRSGEFKGVKYVVLNSPGGEGPAGLEFAQIVREQGLTTIVPAGGTCASACTFIFQAGVKRVAYDSSLFMYHGPRMYPGALLAEVFELCNDKGQAHCQAVAIQNGKDKAQSEMVRIFDLLESYGMSPELFKLYKTLPDEEDGEWQKNDNFFLKPDLFFVDDLAHPSLQKARENAAILSLEDLTEYGVVTHWNEKITTK